MGAPATAIRIRHDLHSRLVNARARTDELFRVIREEAIYDRPIPERHRIIFYVGHIEAFDWNLLAQRAFGLRPIQRTFDQLFAFGIDPVDGGLPSDAPADWPERAEVERYNRRIRDELDHAIEHALERPAEGHPQLIPMLEVAIEHRLMHAETLAYMLHQLPLEMKAAPPGVTSAAQYARNVEASPMVRVSAGVAVLGMKKEDGRFGWDNEFGEQRVQVEAFEIDRYMVTNAQFREFIDAGGYRNRAYWNDKDWAWKEAEGVAHPVTWSQNADGQWTLRTMFEDIALPPDWPVYVSHAEASAYARWAGKALPTEAQWQRAAQGVPNAPSGNYDFRSWDPQAVDASPDNVSAFGVEGQFGNGWEWTSSLFDALPGFEAFPFYLGYSANFYDGQHYVLKGGSARTAQCMMRPTFRNWFQPRYQHVYAGFRCVRV